MEIEAIHFFLPETSYGWFRIAYLMKYGAISGSDGGSSNEESLNSESSDDIYTESSDEEAPTSPCIRRNAHSFSSSVSTDSALC